MYRVIVISILVDPNSLVFKFAAEMSANQSDFEDQVSMTVDDDEISGYESDCGDSNSAVSDRFDVFTRNGMIRLEEENSAHDIIKTCFLSGMGFAGGDTNLVAIHKNVSSDLTRQARFESFKIFSQAVAQKCGGDAKVKYAWYGGSKDELCEILVHGFSRCREPAPNEQSYGVGVHLFSPVFAYDGALSSAVDERGLRHMLLCRVILGKMETVAPGSKQSHPSSKEMDTGVDNLQFPRRYVVWSAFMNSHIFPVYVVSFKAPSPNVVSGIHPGIQPRQANTSKPTSPWVTFPALMFTLAKFLPPPKMLLIVKSHNEFRAKRITRPQLIRKVRQIVGDNLLIQVIKGFRSKSLHPASAKRTV